MKRHVQSYILNTVSISPLKFRRKSSCWFVFQASSLRCLLISNQWLNGRTLYFLWWYHCFQTERPFPATIDSRPKRHPRIAQLKRQQQRISTMHWWNLCKNTRQVSAPPVSKCMLGKFNRWRVWTFRQMMKNKLRFSIFLFIAKLITYAPHGLRWTFPASVLASQP